MPNLTLQSNSTCYQSLHNSSCPLSTSNHPFIYLFYLNSQCFQFYILIWASSNPRSFLNWRIQVSQGIICFLCSPSLDLGQVWLGPLTFLGKSTSCFFCSVTSFFWSVWSKKMVSDIYDKPECSIWIAYKLGLCSFLRNSERKGW